MRATVKTRLWATAKGKKPVNVESFWKSPVSPAAWALQNGYTHWRTGRVGEYVFSEIKVGA